MEVRGGSLAEVKKMLQAAPEILATTQIGLTLRIMVSQTVQDPERWLAARLPGAERYTIGRTEPSIEDVFVRATCKVSGTGR